MKKDCKNYLICKESRNYSYCRVKDITDEIFCNKMCNDNTEKKACRSRN